MKIIGDKISEIIVIEPKVFGDERGYFLETFQLERYRGIGIVSPFVQDNISRSRRGVLRGLHYQLKYPQGKLITVIRGKIFDVVVDIRRGSPTFGSWNGFILNDDNHVQLYIPSGFAHGFCVLSEFADIHYKCTDYYRPGDEFGVCWNDPELAIEWPNLGFDVILSEKDNNNKMLSAIPLEFLPLL